MENVVLEKSFSFAVRVVNAYRYLNESKKEYILSKQLLRCGTSIGANIEEAMGAQSKKDFVSKLSIARKEARETHYWVRLLEATKFFNESESRSLLNDIDEILKILTQIILTTKSQIKKSHL